LFVCDHISLFFFTNKLTNQSNPDMLNAEVQVGFLSAPQTAPDRINAFLASPQTAKALQSSSFTNAVELIRLIALDAPSCVAKATELVQSVWPRATLAFR
jgi:hypothetical protein